MIFWDGFRRFLFANVDDLLRVHTARYILELHPMNKDQGLSHPEIELRPNLFNNSTALNLQTATIVDLLEVYADHVDWKERLDHSSLLNHFRVSSIRVTSYNQLSL